MSENPPEQSVDESPDETRVGAGVPLKAPDQARGGDVEEILRDDLVRPGDARGVERVTPDQAGRGGRARVPGDVLPLIVLTEGDLALGVEAVVVGDARPPHVQ